MLDFQKYIPYPLQKAVGPSLISMVIAQLTAPLYCPGTEFMKRVFITSTGDATIVVQKPAANAAVKWHGMLSAGKTDFKQTRCWRESQKDLHLPVIRLYFKMSSFIMSQVTSSEQFTMALRVIFGRQPVRTANIQEHFSFSGEFSLKEHPALSSNSHENQS